jgi:glutamine amidotransferase
MSPSKTVIIDYGLGNLRSVAAAITEVGGTPEITTDPDTVHRAERIILPGVGAFGVAAKYLETSGLGNALVAAAGQGAPVLGICLGMQLLFDRGNEFGWSRGLGLIQGDVLPILGSDKVEGLRGTHIGWRQLKIRSSPENHPLFKGIAASDSFYFVHSFSAQSLQDNAVLASVSYGANDLVVIASNGNVIGVQFHPEKSGIPGLRVLKNFIQH